ncbi:MAG TPA: tetratricopeptide repeat protein [Candidatus Edwardsbacteria bacterium]|nr:tetratricopeptide repeat protein [Candidatus Edwardsbacteria bacterium]
MRTTIVILCCALALASCAPRQAMERGDTGMQSLDLVSLAAICEQQGDLKGAIAALKQARKRDPGSAVLDLMIAQDYYELGNDTLAALYARRAIKLEPRNADNYLVLGNSDMIAREFDDALQQYRVAAGLKPDASDILVTMAGLYEATGQPDSAVATLQREAARSNDRAVRHALASALTRRQRWADARDQYRLLLAGDPSDLKATYSLGLLFEIDGQPDSAVAWFDRASGLQPANTSIRKHVFNLLLSHKEYADAILEAEDILQLEPNDGGMRLQLARLYYLQQDFDAAATQFDSLLRVDSTNTEALYTVARLRLQQKRYGEAAQYYRRTLRILPRLDEAWVSLGICQLQSGMADSAGYCFKQARKHGGRMDVDYLFGFGYSQLEQYDKALPCYERAYARDKKDVTFLFNMAAAHERAGNFDRAVELFTRLLQLDPKHASALNYLGYMYADRGVKLDEAAALVKRALELEPDNAYFLDSMGWVYYRFGDYGAALPPIERAVKMMPGDATLRDHLGDVYRAQGSRDRAVEQWTKALQLDPARTEIRKKIDDAASAP